MGSKEMSEIELAAQWCDNEYTATSEEAFKDIAVMLRTQAAKIEALEKASKWQPIETAPKDKYILVADFGEYPDAPDIYVAEWFDFGKYWSTSHGRVHGVSHWQPLPQPPIAG
jgi:hypothetical protein